MANVLMDERVPLPMRAAAAGCLKLYIINGQRGAMDEAVQVWRPFH